MTSTAPHPDQGASPGVEGVLEYRDEDHSYWLGSRRLPSVTQILKAEGWMGNMQWYTEDGRQTGEDVAVTTALFDQGEPAAGHAVLEALPDVKPYVEAWRKYVNASGFQIEAVEERVCDSLLGYAGTLDRRGTIDGLPTVVDMKRYGFEPWHALQLTAYAWACESSFALPYRCEHVQLKPSGAFSRQIVEMNGFIDQWRAALANFHGKCNHGVIQWPPKS